MSNPFDPPQPRHPPQADMPETGEDIMLMLKRLLEQAEAREGQTQMKAHGPMSVSRSIDDLLCNSGEICRLCQPLGYGGSCGWDSTWRLHALTR